MIELINNILKTLFGFIFMLLKFSYGLVSKVLKGKGTKPEMGLDSVKLNESDKNQNNKIYYASFGERLIARIIDVIIILIPCFIIPPLLIIGYFIWMAYSVVMWTSSGATIGQSLMKIKLVNQNGDNISSDKAIKRFLSYLLCDFSFGLGYIKILFDDHNQGWHDKIASTYVIKSFKDKDL